MSQSTSSGVGGTVSPTQIEHKLCIICAGQSSDKIVKDDNYVQMMDLYWKGVRVDVKPEWNKEFELCVECFDEILQFFQINDVLVYFETKLKQIQRSILSSNLKGILKWKEKGLKLHRVQNEIFSEWGTKLEMTEEVEANERILNTYTVTQSFEFDKNDNKGRYKDETGFESDVTVIATKEFASGISSPEKRTRQQKKNTPRNKRKKIIQRVRRDSETEVESSDDGSNYSDDMMVAGDEDYSAPTTRDRNTKRNGANPSSSAANASTSGSNDFDSSEALLAWTASKECKICLDNFASSSIFLKHMRHHKVSEGEGYECRLCRQTFTRQTKLVDHKKTCSDVSVIAL